MFVFSFSFALSAAQEASYHMITDGTCAENLMAPVKTTAECEAAAQILDLTDQTVGTTNTVSRPEGCYFTDSLWFAHNGNLGATCCTDNGDARKPICRNGPEPVPAPDARRFQMITDGNCEDHGFRTVKSVPDCDVAAKFLDLGDPTVGTTNNAERPEGCYFTDSLWFAHNGELGFTCCSTSGISRKPICELPKMTWEMVRETDIADAANSDLVPCVSHNGVDIRTDLAAIEDCMHECEVNPTCIAITTSAQGTMLKQKSDPMEADVGVDSFVLSRVFWDQVDIVDTTTSADFDNLTPCISHEDVDIRADDAKIAECMTECEDLPACVGVVAHPWGALLTADGESIPQALSGFDLYFIERVQPLQPVA